MAARFDFLSRGEQNGEWDTIRIFGGGAQDAIQRPHPTLLPVLNTGPAFSNKKAAARFNRFSHRTRGRKRDFQLENGPSSQSPEDKMKQKAEGFRETPGCFRNFKWIGALVAVLLFILPANPFVIIRAGSGGGVLDWENGAKGKRNATAHQAAPDRSVQRSHQEMGRAPAPLRRRERPALYRSQKYR